MKKNYFKILSVLMVLCIGFCLPSCSDDDDDNDNDKSITVPSGQQLMQTVYADDNNSASGVTFTTTSAWTSSIVEVSPTDSKLLRDASVPSRPDWISITPDKGDKGGTYTISVSLSTNYTGVKRSAKIVINCGNEKIEINITQEGEDENGEVPEENGYELGFITLLDNNELVFLSESGDVTSKIYSFDKNKYMYIENYNETKKEVYLNEDVDQHNEDLVVIKNIISLNIETKKQEILVENLKYFDYAYVTNDGEYIIYDKVNREENIYELKKLSVSDAKETLLYKGSEEFTVSVSNDGAVIAVGVPNSVIVIEKDVQKYRLPVDDNYPNFEVSPDGEKLFFLYEDSGLRTCDLDGSNSEIIKTNDPDLEIESHMWSADSKFVYFDYYNHPNKIYKVNVETKETVELTDKYPAEYLYEGSFSVKIPK